MERVSKFLDANKVESGKEGDLSIGEIRLQKLLALVKSGVRRPFVEAAQLPETVQNLRSKISSAWEQSRNESFEDRNKRREAQTGWRASFFGRPLIKAFDFGADIANAYETMKAERVILQERQEARLKLDAVTAERLAKLRQKFEAGTRTRVGKELPTVEEEVVTAFTPQRTSEAPASPLASREITSQTEANPSGSQERTTPANTSLQEVLQRQQAESSSPSLQEVLQRREQSTTPESPVSEAAEPASESEYSQAMLEYMEGIQTHRSEVVTQLEDARAGRDAAEKRKGDLRKTKRAFQSQIYGSSGESVAQAA